MGRFASSARAIAICDVCGFQYQLNELRETTVRGRRTNILACTECWEPDHPQNELGRFPVDDPQAIQNPRPDFAELNASRNFQWGWNPVGGGSDDTLAPNNLKAIASIGSVTVSVVKDDSTANVTGIQATTEIGSVIVGGTIVTVDNPFPVAMTTNVGSVTVNTTSITVYAVTVYNAGSGNKYYIDGVGPAPTLALVEGQTYRFDQSDSSNSGHPLRFSTTSDGTHGGGTQYTTGVSIGADYTEITVAIGAPTLYYYCTNHSGMGGQLNT
jgi:hypothetical protein|tara:strand:+ start:1326 stop:2135 length:810 start_codon:yes stop_codon:yes gene_type:complete